VVDSLKTSLQREYEVEVASDGQSGYYSISEKKPLAVILDVTVSEMDPLAVIGKIRAQKRFSTLPFFILVDSFPDDLADEAMNAGALEVFSKSEEGYVEDVTRALTAHFTPATSRGGMAKAGATRPAQRLVEDPPQKPVVKAPKGVDWQPVANLVASAPEESVNETDQLRQLFAESFSGRVHAARQAFVVYMTAKDSASRASYYDKFYKTIASLRAEAAQCELNGLVRLLDPLDRRAKELRENVEGASAGSRQVLANAIDLMASMNHQVSELPALNRLMPTALVMDDEAVSRRAITLGLEKAQIRVTAVDSGDAAIRECEVSRFDLILLDVEMPGMNGFAVCARLRAMPEHRETPILFISALDDLRSRASSKISGGNQFITKPVNFLELSITANALVLKQCLKEIDRLVLSNGKKSESFVFPD
jgi:DNA-binding response OmpR family regulator